MTVSQSPTYGLSGQMTDDGGRYKYVYDAFGRLRKVLNRSNDALVEESRYDGPGHRIAWRYDADASGTVVTSGTGADPWYFLVYDDKWRSVATLREGDSNAKKRLLQPAPMCERS